MKIYLEAPQHPKVCFRKPGDVIEIGGTLFLVCRYDLGRPNNPLASNGLYSNENPHFLVDLVTGQARPMLHLSARVRHVTDVAVTTIKE
jgi:hypothetical protein